MNGKQSSNTLDLTKTAELSTDTEPAYVHRTHSVIFIEPGFGPHSCNTQCPYCYTQVITVDRSKPGLFTWIAAMFFCFIGFPCCLCFVPFCVRDCADIEHVCPVCHQVIGIYKRM